MEFWKVILQRHNKATFLEELEVTDRSIHQNPNPDEAYPLEHHQKTCFLKNIVTNPNITVV
jgi:hypothetical protein